MTTNTDLVRALIHAWRTPEPDNGEPYTEYDEGFDAACEECADALEKVLASAPPSAPVGVGGLPGLPCGVAVVTAKPGCAGTSAHVRVPQEEGTQLYSPQQVRDLMQQVAALAQQPDDVNRLVRELDVALNGPDGAAAQASLCDLVSQVQRIVRERGAPLLAPSAPVEVELAAVASILRHALRDGVHAGYGRDFILEQALAIEALTQQPAAPSGEAVAYRWRDRGTMQMVYSDTNPGYCNVEPLYAAPQQPAGVDDGTARRIEGLARRWDESASKDKNDDRRAAKRKCAANLRALVAALAAQQQEPTT